jgi:hypothetical protein
MFLFSFFFVQNPKNPNAKPKFQVIFLQVFGVKIPVWRSSVEKWNLQNSRYRLLLLLLLPPTQAE